MKFKSDIEVQAGLRDGGNDIGTAGQLLSSTGTVTNWIDQGDVVAAGATRVLIACKNTSGGTITKGTPVYQTGNVGATDVIEVAEADALISTGYLPAIGLLETDLINNAFGHVVITGELLNITTSPIDGVVPVTGDTVYLKSGGGLTLTKPTGEGNAIQNLGLVGKVSGGNAGSLTVASIMRQNDVPNLPEGRIWIGDGNTIVSNTVYVDEPNNRVGIGTTSPTAKLDVYGNLRLGTTGNFTIAQSPFLTTVFYVGAGNGSTITFGAPASNTQNVSVQGDFHSYQGSIGTKNSSASFNNKISYNGDNYLNSGNLGIGTTTPSTDLEVSSTGVNGVDISQSASNASQSGRLFFTTNTASEGFALFNSNGTFQVNSGGIPNNTSGTNRISIIGSSGNVGIGTTSPSTKLHVSGGEIRIDDTKRLQFGAGGVAINNDAAGRMYSNAPLGYYWQAASSYKMVLLSSGNLGIGTTIPGSKLTVNGSTNLGGNVEVSDGLGGDKTLTLNANIGHFSIGDIDGLGDQAFISGDSSSISISTNQITTLHCDSNNRVGIGTTNPQEKLHVSGSSNVRLEVEATDSTVAALKITNTAGSYASFVNASGDLSVYDYNANDTRTTLLANGNFGIGTTSPQSRLQVNGGIQLANDTASPSASKVGTFRYRTSGNNSYVDMCMQTGASTYAWVNIVTNSW